MLDQLEWPISVADLLRVLSNTAYRQKFAAIIEANTKATHYTLVGNKPLQDIGRELNPASIPAEGCNHRRWILIPFQVFIAGYTEINN